MGEFVIPNDPADLWLDERRDDLTLVVSDHSLDFTDENTIVQYSEEISYALCGDNPLCVCEQSKFDVLATIIKEWHVLPGKARVQLLDALTTSIVCLSAWMDGVLSSPDDSEDRSLLGEYRSAYKVYIFLAQWIAKVSSREAMATSMNASALEAGKKGGGRRKKKDGDWDWQEQSGKLLKSVARCMALDLWKVFRPARPDDAVLVSLIQLSTNCLSCAKDAEAVRHAGQILGLTGLRYQQLDAVSAAMVDLLSQYEHTPAMVAEMLRYSVSEWDDGRLAAAVIQEVASIDAVEYERQQNATGEKAGVRSVAAFVDELAKKLPKLMVTQMSLLLPHLGGKAWTLRSGIITAIGHLLARAFETSDGKEEQDAVIARLRTKQHLLDILCERTRDQSSYTRKAVLQTWQYLAENRAIPLGHWQVVTSIATGRLEDKSSLVRKEAMRLMGCLMLHNPFGPSLPLDKFVASLDIHSAMLEQVMPQVDMPVAQENAEATVKSEPVEHDSSDPVETERRVSMGAVTVKTPAEVGWDGTVEELQALVASLELAAEFSRSLTASMPSLVNLLASSTVSDVQDSIALLLTCKQFEIVGAPEAIRKMLALIFSREQNIKDKVVEALDQLYLSGWAGHTYTSAQAAKNLVELACGATLGELGSLEEAVKCFAEKGLITSVTVHELWELANQHSRDMHVPEHRLDALKHVRGTMAVLSMAVGVIPETMASSRVHGLLQIVFERCRGDALTTRHACVALGRIENFADESYNSVREDVYTALVRVVISSEIPDAVWYTVTEASLRALYSLHPKPEDVSCAMIHTLAEQAFAGRGQDDNPPPSYLTSKVFFLIGEISLRHLVLIEKSAKYVRRARLDAERKAAEASGNPSKRNAEEDINAELGVGGVAADAELDNMKDAAERQIVQFSNSIIKPFAKMVINTCRHPSFHTAEPTLKSSALLALTKLMVVDVKICESNLQLLFTLLQNRVVEPKIRSNLVIALGDLALRFPNALEPWTEHVYRPLGDPDTGVRKTAMMVLTHLILNDMMKVKGHIAKMAACLEDSDERVAALASLFFHELAKKEYKGTSPIYNLLPDMLSVLSRDTSLTNAQFQSVMQQLLVHIKKDKHGDALVEKLCQRFASTEDALQWRNIAFCISQLPTSDKGVKKLIEGHIAYKNALEDDETAQIMLAIVAKVKKSASKPESKELADDFESKVLHYIAEWKEINGEVDGETMDGVEEQMNDLTVDDTNKENADGRLSGKQPNGAVGESPLHSKNNTPMIKEEEPSDDLIAAVQNSVDVVD
ncbi:Condensin complex subunit 1 [Picochlorum sp. SENEW3]|nr:Condensin complex subunit 1 [Picochlorum sp. SENEW3]WPT17135.1 Condensin complex subunit 1 [Picochlorum sp. SENEW3]